VTQFFTVPSTTESPYPTLPITFPNLALYLQSVLEDSRQAANDVNGSYRRLGKMLDTYYREEIERPVEDEGTEDAPIVWWLDGTDEGTQTSWERGGI